MKVLSYLEFATEKNEFFNKHNYDYKVEDKIDTNPEDGSFGKCYKQYTFKDGGVWCEGAHEVCETAVVEIKKVNVEVRVKMIKTVFWNTDNPENRCYYENRD